MTKRRGALGHPMGVLSGCLAVHVVLSAITPSFWWLPDVTLVGLMLAVLASPEHWLIGSVIAGSGMTLFAIRHTAAITAAYVVIGGVTRWLIPRWDVQDLRVQAFLIGGGSLVMTLWLVSLDQPWSVLLVAGAVARAVLTALSAALVRRLAGARTVARR